MYLLNSRTIGSGKGLRPDPQKGLIVGSAFRFICCHQDAHHVSQEHPANRSSPVVRQNIFMGFYIFPLFLRSFLVFGFCLAANIFHLLMLMLSLLFWFSGSSDRQNFLGTFYCMWRIVCRLPVASWLDLHNFWIFLQSCHGWLLRFYSAVCI